MYLTSIMDLFSRRIIAWRLSKTLEARWVVECIEEAKKYRIMAEPLIVHSDRGSQYISQAYLKALDKIKPSYSRKASPWQNACIESFHALIKGNGSIALKSQTLTTLINLFLSTSRPSTIPLEAIVTVIIYHQHNTSLT